MSLYSGANRLLSGGVGLLAAIAEEEDMALLASTFDTAGSNSSTTSTSLVDLSSNLDVTFTAPATGNVLVMLQGICQPDSSNGSVKIAYWGLRESSTDVAGPFSVAIHPTGVSNFYVSVTLVLQVTGLTPSSSHTYKWAHATTSGATSVVSGGSQNPRAIIVWGLP